MVKEPVHLRDARDKHEKMFVGSSYVFDGDVL